MASLFARPNGRFEIHFAYRSRRRSLRLGGIVSDHSSAKFITAQVEQLVKYRETGQALPKSLAGWIDEIGGKLRKRLEKQGLLDPVDRRETVTMGDLFEHVVAVYADRNRNTRRNIMAAADRLVAFFGRNRRLEAITTGDCQDFRRSVSNLAPTTETEICRKSVTVFNLAVSKRWIDSNPFSGMKDWAVTNDTRSVYVPIETIRRVLSACCDEWRSIVLMARIAGMRPCEIVTLEWSGVDFASERIALTSPKTGFREFPLFPDVAESLDRHKPARDNTSGFVIPRYRGDHHKRTIDSGFRRRIRKSGVNRWPKLFTNLRASAEMDLLDDGFALQTVAEWLGHSPTIAARHYVRANETHFERAKATRRIPKCAAQGAADRPKTGRVRNGRRSTN